MANYPDIRIGNDIPMEWSFYYPSEEGSEERRPFNLEGRDLTVTMSRLGQGRPIEDFLVEGNKIIFTFYGKDQAGFGTGVYTLTLCENLGENNMHTLDKMEVFRLVSRQETVISGEPYTSSMVSTLEVAPLMFESVVGADYLSHDDIADDLDTDDPNYVLSARMGVVLREAIEDESDNAIHKSGNETIVSGVKTFGPDSTLAISGGDLVLTDKDANLSTILDDESDARANADEALSGRLSGVETEMQKVVNITVGGTDTYFRGAVYAPSVNVTGTIRANSLIESRGNISASGGVTAGGALRGSSVVSSGPISENGMPLSQRYMAIGNAYTKSQTDTLLGEKADAEEVDSALAAKQDALVSGTNIKTINNTSLLGSGNIDIQGGGGGTIDNEVTKDSANAVKSSGIYAALGKYGVVSQNLTYTKNSDGSFTITISDIERGLIPQSFIDLAQCGYEGVVVFNETTGYFEMNGLTDISYAEMRQIYWAKFVLQTMNAGGDMFSFLLVRPGEQTRSALRTLYPRLNNLLVITGSCFRQMGGVETLAIVPESLQAASSHMAFFANSANISYAFYNANNVLKRILTPLLCQANTTFANTTFGGCPSLEEVTLNNLHSNIWFSVSPNLTAASVAYMINNSSTSAAAFTITLHATAYARAIADADVQAALAAHTNVTLASA